MRKTLLYASLIPLLAACAQEADPPAPETAAEAAVPAETLETPAPGPAVSEMVADEIPRRAFFGDTHVHTGWSADAGMDGAVTSPEDAYRFALGQEVTSNSGLKAQLGRPYDWFMVTDHSDGMGTINEILAGNPEMIADETIKRWYEALTSGDEKRAAAAKSELVVMQSEERLPAVVMDPKWMKSAWEKTVQAAEDFYDPGTFTTFIAYEWTVNAGGGDNLHRNVIFKGTGDQALQVLPLTTFETQDPEKLWEWMANYEAKTGDSLHAIPHNGNMSNGRMFEESRFDGSPMTPDWAEQRQKYERLYEVTQIKGQSESHPMLSPDDEFSDWDLWDRGNLILNPKPEGALPYEYWRPALAAGLRLEDSLGANPFKYGANAGTDTHTGLSSTEEGNFFGKFKTLEPTNIERWDFPLLTGPTDAYMGWEMAASGVTGVWSTENTREAIWDAMYRRETFATSGPRMSVRFFGGYDFAESDFDGDWVAKGYADGVPMGADLASGPEGAAPSFLVAAMKDPESGGLDRVQVIKVWVDAEGQAQERIYDLAWSGERQPGPDGKLPAVESTVNPESATFDTTAGAAQLTAAWTDPEFDPSIKAVYYVRVLEIPTPRWTLYDQVNLGAEPGPDVPLVHQERAFSSPIWYTP